MHTPPHMESLNVHINGRQTTLERGATIATLVTNLQIEGKRFAVERNGDIVPKSALTTTLVADGDCYEIVIAVGGG